MSPGCLSQSFTWVRLAMTTVDIPLFACLFISKWEFGRNGLATGQDRWTAQISQPNPCIRSPVGLTVQPLLLDCNWPWAPGRIGKRVQIQVNPNSGLQADGSPCIVIPIGFPVSITLCISLAFQLSWTFLFILAAGRRGNTAQKDLPLPKEDQASDNELHFVTRQKKLPITRRKGKSRREEEKSCTFTLFCT